MRYTHDGWSIDLPESWKVEPEEEHMFLFDSEEINTFGITAFYKEDGDFTHDEVLEFTDVLDDNSPGRSRELTFNTGVERLEVVDIPYLKGVSKKTNNETEVHIRWWLYTAHQLIFATYVCDKDQEGTQSKTREGVIMSLRSHYG